MKIFFCIIMPLLVSSFSVMRTATRMTRLSMMSSAPLSHKVAFMFPGQGAQTVGMGAALANDIPAAKALYDTASSILG
jgi:acyl transferase domain-containing protein